MTEALKQAILDFEMQRITKQELLSKLPFSIENKSVELRALMNEIIKSKKGPDVEYGLTLLWLLEENNEFTDILHTLILEPWHSRYEDIIHALQVRKNPSSVPVIKIAIQQKFEHLEASGTGTGQFISQCGHALKSIGTEEAIETIKELSEKSEDPVIRTEMKYRLNKIRSQPKPTQPEPEPEKVKRWWNF